ncbi:hypothetical protein KAS08_06135 [Candidatus Pacearchaeota archaeon]|nr:hypothetical protein [Candidatus Pacearchaeota archaeon]
MATKESVYEMTMKQKGYWNFSDTYAFLYDWLKQKKYGLAEESYEESSGAAKEIKIKWKATKKVTDYFKYEIALDWHILGMKDAEVEVEGKVKKTNKGDLKIKVEGTFIRDYDSTWEGKPFWQFARGLYEKYIIASNVKEYSDGLEDEATAMVEDLKAFLQMAQ